MILNPFPMHIYEMPSYKRIQYFKGVKDSSTINTVFRMTLIFAQTKIMISAIHIHKVSGFENWIFKGQRLNLKLIRA